MAPSSCKSAYSQLMLHYCMPANQKEALLVVARQPAWWRAHVETTHMLHGRQGQGTAYM